MNAKNQEANPSLEKSRSSTPVLKENQRIQTAEGWKREMIKKRKQKKESR